MDKVLPDTYGVTKVGDVAHLKQMIAESAPHAVMIEVSKEQMQRLDLCMELRGENVPVFACCSAKDVDKPFLVAVARTRVLGVLMKPFQMDAALEKLNQISS